MATVVYYIWRERNARLFKSEEMNKKCLMKIIESNIRLQLRSLKVKKSAQVMRIGQKWNVEMNYGKDECRL